MVVHGYCSCLFDPLWLQHLGLRHLLPTGQTQHQAMLSCCNNSIHCIFLILIKTISSTPTWSRRFFFSDSKERTLSLRALFSTSSLSFCSLARWSFIISVKRQNNDHEYLKKYILDNNLIIVSVLFSLSKAYYNLTIFHNIFMHILYAVIMIITIIVHHGSLSITVFSETCLKCAYSVHKANHY